MRKFRTLLLYRGSTDGWMAADFHDKSDGKGPTVSLFKINENGQCIGGYTSESWVSHESLTNVSDSTARVFNLTTKK
jgi:hypothetical protein